MYAEVRGIFHWADYLLFSASLGVGLVMGLVFMLRGRRQKSNDDYLLGGGNMNVCLIGGSLAVSTLNAIFLLGGTAEVYYR